LLRLLHVVVTFGSITRALLLKACAVAESTAELWC